MKNDKKILIIAATHGDEKIGIEVINNLRRGECAKKFDCLIANPLALKKNVRFVDVDLNRVYPGKKKSLFYEERKAYDNLEIAKNYNYIIDIHEANEGTEDFIIIPREKVSRSFPMQFVGLEKILLWPDPKGPLGQILDKAIELEFGMKNRKRKDVIMKVTEIVERFIKKINSETFLDSYNFDISNKEIYNVYGKLLSEGKRIGPNKLKDFESTEICGEKFYPLLVGEYLNDGIICYKMRKKDV